MNIVIRRPCLALMIGATSWVAAPVMLPLQAAEQSGPEKSRVFKAGEANYSVYKAPQILVTKAGTVLAFAQGRQGWHDQSANDIVYKRSVDGGRTWSPLKIAADSGADSLNSVCVVQVREKGRIILMGGLIPHGYARMEFKYLHPLVQANERKAGHEHLPTMRAGYDEPGISRTYVVTSDDDGVTWSKMVDVTRSTKFPAPHLWAMPGPGLAIQLRGGPHAGRIVVPCYSKWLDMASSPPKHRNSTYAVYSDDRGKTWARGEFMPGFEKGNGGETQIVEMEDGSILLNARANGRTTARSIDGGKTWQDVKVEKQLKSYDTAAGFFRYSSTRDGEKNRIMFTNPVAKGRTEGRVWLSYDDGRSWAANKLIEPGRFGYSTMARLPDNSVGCIFWDNAGVVLTRFTLEWLTDGKDRP